MLAKLALLLCTVSLIAGACAAPFIYQRRFDRKHAAFFERTEIGSTKAELEARAGLPSYVTDGTRWVEPKCEKSADQLVPGCVEEYWYRSRVVYLPSRWAYCLDKNGVVISKYHWFSW